MMRAHAPVRTVHSCTVRESYLFRKQGIGMDISDMQRIGPIDHQRTVGRIAAAILLPHLTVVSIECRMARGVVHLHLMQHLTKTDPLVIKDRIARHHLPVHMVYYRPIEQHRPFRGRVIPPAGSGNLRLLLIDDQGRTHDIRHLRLGVIE